MKSSADSNATVSRRAVLRQGLAAGSLAAGGLIATATTTAQQGGVAYLKRRHLRGGRNPTKQFQIIELCWTDDVDLSCDGAGDKTYAAYKIRCPNFPGGGGMHAAAHEDGCAGGGQHGCGRHMLVNPNRNVRLGGLYVFHVDRTCGIGPGDDEYVKGTFRPVTGPNQT